MADTPIKPITSGYNVSKINDNFDNIQAKLDGPVLSSSDGQNVMYQDFDLNGNDILNGNILNVQGLTIAGAAVSPTDLGSLGPNTVATAQIIDGSVTDSKIVSVSGPKVSYKQNGTGAVTSDIQKKVRSIEVSVDEFGAVADYNPSTDTGTDNTAVFLLAYNYLVSLGGGTLVLGPGNYMGTFNIVHPYIRVKGKGPWATNLYNVNNTPIFTLSNASRAVSHCGISDLTMQNRNASVWTSSVGISINGVNTATNCDFNTFKNLYIYTLTTGISLTGRTIWNTWEEVRTAGNGSAGLALSATDNAGAQTFINCRFGTSSQYGILINSISPTIPIFNWAFYGCTIEQNLLNGLRLTGTGAGIQAWTFNNCYFEENAYNIPVGGSGGLVRGNVQADSIQNILGLVFDNCTFYGDSSPQPNMDYGLYINTTGMSTVVGEVRACRFGVNTVNDIFWPKGLITTQNVYSAGGLNTQRSLGSVNLAELGSTHKAFTPVLQFGGASVGIGYSNQIGRYLQIGNMVFFEIYISLTSKGSSTGQATITGLPVPTSSAPSSLIPAYSIHGDQFGASVTNLMARSPTTGGNSLEINRLNAGTATSLTDADFGNFSRFSITGFYFT